jgi:hypothetical protein
MPRPEFKGTVNFQCPGMPERFAKWASELRGEYDVEVVPRRRTVSHQQRKYWFGCVCQPFADFLRSQEPGLSPWAAKVLAHNTLKDQCLRTELVNKATGEILGSYVPSLSDLTVEATSDLIERSRAWLLDTLGIRTPDAAAWIEPPAVATAAG